MSWNYRLTRRQELGRDIFEIREFYYKDDGSIQGWTASPVELTGESPADIKADLELILRDTFARPVIDITDEKNPKEI